MKIHLVKFFFLFVIFSSYSQNYGPFPKIEKEKLLRELDLLHQGLDQFHSGMYWYTPKDSVDLAFQTARTQLTEDLNVIEFYKLITPLVGLSREAHTVTFFTKEIHETLNSNETIRFLPITVQFLGEKMYCIRNGSTNSEKIETLEIETINGETPIEIVAKIGNQIASDGFIKAVKLSDLNGFTFSKNYYYYYGILDTHEIKFKERTEPIVLEAQSYWQVLNNIQKYFSANSPKKRKKDPLQFRIIDANTAYLRVGTFSNPIIKEDSQHKSLKKFLKACFQEIKDKNIENVIVDVSGNDGGTEGNEGLLYSYFGDNYKKYKKVSVKKQKLVLDNGIDAPITLKAYGFFEKWLFNKKMPDDSYERTNNPFIGLMAYKKEPKNKFKGTTYILISPITYSGASEFSNMMYSNGLGTFIGEETGGGYLGNTSGYGRRLKLPHSTIEVEIPVIQFEMNVAPKLPFGRGVIPHYKVIPTIEQHTNSENAALEYALKMIGEKN